ncbi:MAG: HNH endonuclease [Candidatus Bathyarchaeia archaeon]
MKLSAELVPSTVWYSSLYRLLPSDVWNRLRDQIIKENGRKCQICGETTGTMNLHERWSYNDTTHIQKLEGFILLCRMCHHIKHIGLAGILANEGKLDYTKVVKHFCSVNSCSEKEFTKHVNEAFSTWSKRSQHQWRQDFGEYTKYLQI